VATRHKEDKGVRTCRKKNPGSKIRKEGEEKIESKKTIVEESFVGQKNFREKKKATKWWVRGTTGRGKSLVKGKRRKKRGPSQGAFESTRKKEKLKKGISRNWGGFSAPQDPEVRVQKSKFGGLRKRESDGGNNWGGRRIPNGGEPKPTHNSQGEKLNGVRNKEEGFLHETEGGMKGGQEIARGGNPKVERGVRQVLTCWGQGK